MSIFLYTVTDCERSPGGVVLLPGIPHRLIDHPEVNRARQGSPVELKFPDGTNLRTVIASYGVRVPLGTTCPENIFELPIQITVSKPSEHEIIPIGTEVWLPL